MRQQPLAAFAAATLIAMGAANAQAPSPPGTGFLRIFTGLCVHRIANLESLRSELKAKGLPQLQETAARAFLDGRPGDVWPIPESGVLGNLVLVLPTDHVQCSVLARKGPTGPTEAEFRKLVTSPPPPVRSELKIDRSSSTPSDGEIHTLGYIWKMDGRPSALAFFLSTAASSSASVQLKATVARVARP